MIRLITTTIIGLILVTGGLAVYQDAGGGLDGVLGGLVRHGGPSTTATPECTLNNELVPCGAAPGVDVPNAAAGPATPTPPSSPAVSTSAPAAAPATMTLAQGEAVVRAQKGFGRTCTPADPTWCADPPIDASGWCDTCAIHVIWAEMPHFASCWPDAAFFFTDRYIGTDTRLGSDTLMRYASRTDDTVTLRYSLYNDLDAPCFPQGGTADVRFHWDGSRLVPLDPIPEHRSPWWSGAPAPTAAAPGPAASECAWAVATLREDARLDLAGAATMPDQRDWLTTTAGWWTQIADWITASCVPPWPPAQCTPARTELTTARTVHENVTPGAAFGQSAQANADWNATWIANYTRLLALVGQLCT